MRAQADTIVYSDFELLYITLATPCKLTVA